ncbi:MAG TPA: sigma-54 dependent transcriptional regulator [Candidatus Binatia bacterium]|jgi:DNA-binding NtrC family response regulator
MASLGNRARKTTEKQSRASVDRLKSEVEKEKAALPQLIPTILVVDDESLICQQLERLYTHAGYKVAICNSVEQALTRLEEEDIDLVVTDIRLPGLSGIELTKRMHETYPDVPVIVITGFGDIGNAVEVLKLGASDYIVKPFSGATIQESTRVVLEKAQIFTEIRHLRRILKDQCEFGGMLSKTPEMHRVFEIIRMVSDTDMTVLVEGETGTGKELVASAIHYQSRRRQGPLITINCAGVPETLLESELFGYERGAFTGADQARPGKIELAHGGTLFLDEIESISLPMQAKLLRVLEDQKVQRLGSSRKIQIDMRVIAATNVPLKELVAGGQMRTDFYYRINVIPIHLVPLRNRREDIQLLVHDFIHHHPLAVSKGITGVSQQAMTRLMQYAWPGNIRELQNVLERAIVMTSRRVIEKIDLPETTPLPPSEEIPTSMDLSLRDWLREQEKQYLARQLKTFGGRIGPTARHSGVDVKTLYRKMREYGLDKKDFQAKLSAQVLSTNQVFAGLGNNLSSQRDS